MTPDAPKPSAPKPTTKKPSNKKPTMRLVKGGVNKSEEIRKIATGMKAKGEKPRPKTIIEILKKQGIAVSSPQVSMVLKSMGFRPRRRRKGSKTPVASTSSGQKRTSKVKVEDLVSAKKIVSKMGGVDKALAVLKALKDFEG